MLTADHIDARKKDGELVLSRLDARALGEARELAEAYLEAARAHVGRTREELGEAWKAIGTGARKRRLAAGLEKLTVDRCGFDVCDALDPVELRREVFREATKVRRAREGACAPRPFDREAVIAAIAERRGRTTAELEAALFSDLRGEHVLRAAPAASAEALVEAYELGRAQAVLLRAVRVTVQVEGASPGSLRAFFARLKFHQLLFAVARVSAGSFAITIDGPFSMFDSVTKYGVRFALVVPALRELESWSLVADLRWGKERAPLTFRMSSRDITARDARDAREDDGAALEPHVSDEVRALLEGVEALRGPRSTWRAAIAAVLLDQPGLGVCIPDLALTDDTGAIVYVEVLGFWSRDAVWKRVELAQSGLGARVVFCASARLRVSTEVLDDEAPAALYVYKGKPSARALLEHVHRVAKASLVSGPEPPYPPAPCPTSSSPEPRAGSAKPSPAST